MSHEKHQEEAQFLNEILPMDDDVVPPVKRGRKRFVIVLPIRMFGFSVGLISDDRGVLPVLLPVKAKVPLRLRRRAAKAKQPSTSFSPVKL